MAEVRNKFKNSSFRYANFQMDLLGGVSTHISPFVKAQDIGGLLTAAGFQMITLDTEEIQVVLNKIILKK